MAQREIPGFYYGKALSNRHLIRRHRSDGLDHRCWEGQVLSSAGESYRAARCQILSWKCAQGEGAI